MSRLLGGEKPIYPTTNNLQQMAKQATISPFPAREKLLGPSKPVNP